MWLMTLERLRRHLWLDSSCISHGRRWKITSMRARVKVRLDEAIHFTFSISPLMSMGIWSPPMRAYMALMHPRLSFQSSFAVVTVYLSGGCAGVSRHNAVTGKETAATHLSQERGSLNLVVCVVALLLVCALDRKNKGGLLLLSKWWDSPVWCWYPVKLCVMGEQLFLVMSNSPAIAIRNKLAILGWRW